MENAGSLVGAEFFYTKAMVASRAAKKGWATRKAAGALSKMPKER